MNSREYFEKVADRWDNMRSGFFSEEVREKAYKVADIKKGKQAADIGAGTGFVTEGLAREGLDVIAVDQSKIMMEELKRKFPEIDCRQGEAENLPVANETMDYVFANMFLHHVERPEKAIKEMTRILTSGGRLVITDLNEHSFEFLKREHHDRWMGFNREAIAQWFKDAGLRDVKVECVGQSCCAESCNGTDSAKVSIFIASGIKLYKSS
ncbi:MAG: class I SAM-dependent methyltransferase [Desulfobacterales bacterium]|nr:MAG: class I SAM-dependent methyltransferase [Desulfobacterales bacterium]